MFNWLKKLTNSKTSDYNQVPPDRIPREIYRYLYRNPWARKKLVHTSIDQDLDGSHYHGILNTIANYCVGPAPILIGQSENPEVNANIEDRWATFCQKNEIGNAIRLIRRSAARTGVGFAVPYPKENGDLVKLGFRVVSSERFQNPAKDSLDPNIIEGIEYNEYWDPVKVYMDTGEEYNMNQCILWWKKKDELRLCAVPECSPGLCILPSVQRYFVAIIRSAEFRASIPLAIELDPSIWGKESAGDTVPRGKMEYEPGIVPTLPPGTKLSGIPVSTSKDEDNAALDAMISAVARCLNMPMNLAIGNSAKHNMASSMVDLEPWKDTVMIDREDFAPVVNKVFSMWLDMAKLVPGYFLPETLKMLELDKLPITISYRPMVTHPDPLKRSNALFTDLISGGTTLTRHYTNLGLNPRRELQREAQLLNITYEDLVKVVVANRTPQALQILLANQNNGDQNDNQA